MTSPSNVRFGALALVFICICSSLPYTALAEELPSDLVPTGAIHRMSASGNGDILAVMRDPTSLVLMTREGTVLQGMRFEEEIEHVTLSESGNTLACAGKGGTLFIWSEALDQPAAYPTGNVLNAIGVSDDGRYIIAGGASKKLYLFSSEGDLIWARGLDGDITSLGISSDGRYIATESDIPALWYYSSDGTLLWKHIGGHVVNIAVAGDGSGVAAIFRNYNIYGEEDDSILFDSDEVVFFDRYGNEQWKFRLASYNPVDTVRGLALSEDGSYLAVGAEYDRIFLFDSKGTILWDAEAETRVTEVWISPDGSSVAAACDDNAVTYFDRNGNEVRDIPADPAIRQSVFCNEGVYFVGTGDEGGIRFMNPATGETAWSVSFSLEGYTIRSGSEVIIVGNFSAAEQAAVTPAATADTPTPAPTPAPTETPTAKQTAENPTETPVPVPDVPDMPSGEPWLFFGENAGLHLLFGAAAFAVIAVVILVKYRKEVALIGYASFNGTSTLLGKLYRNYQETHPPAAGAHPAEQIERQTSGIVRDRKEEIRQMLNKMKKKP